MSTRILRQVRQAIEQLNPSEVREAAERPLFVRLHARHSPGYAMMEDFLAPRTVSRDKRYELTKVLFRAEDPQPDAEPDIEIREIGCPRPDNAFVFDPVEPQRMVADVLAARQELGLPLARCCPPFRMLVAEKIINGVARENAVFALMTALPGVAPGLALPWAASEAVSDTAVLTINQIRMAFLLAAASDRNIGYREQKAEIAGLIAGAFGWRALARELCGKIPFGGGLIPKAGIAYAGTYVAGLSLERLYRFGYGLTREERREVYGEALARGRQIAAAVVEAWRNGRRESS